MVKVQNCQSSNTMAVTLAGPIALCDEVFVMSVPTGIVKTLTYE